MRNWKITTDNIDLAKHSDTRLCLFEYRESGTSRRTNSALLSFIDCDPAHQHNGVTEIKNFFELSVKLRPLRYSIIEDKSSEVWPRVIKVWHQFALYNKVTKSSTPIAYFTIMFDDGEVITWDKAFDTPLVTRNGIRIPLGKFPFNQKRHYPVRREQKIEKRALKFFTNQFLKK